jgi:hypothetical protein
MYQMYRSESKAFGGDGRKDPIKEGDGMAGKVETNVEKHL